MIKHIITDAGGVTINVKVMELLKKYKPNPFEIKAIVTVMAGSAEWDKYNKGLYKDVHEFVDVLKQLYPKYAKMMERAFLDDWSSYMKPDVKMWHGLAELKDQGCDIYMLADIPNELHEIVKKYEGYQILSGGVFSHEEHMRKPDIRMYQTLLDRYGLEAGECVMIDDESAYLKPAEKLGMHTIRFTNADDTIKKLHELLK